MKIKLILFTILLTLRPFIAFATDFYIAKSELNVRTGSSSSFPAVFTLKNGSDVEVISKEKGWYKISYLGRTGYVSSKYLKFNRTVSDTRPETADQNDGSLAIIAYAGLVLLVCFIVYRKIRDKNLLDSVTSKRRGTKSERELVLRLLKLGFSDQSVFHDLYVEKRKGEFSQSDVVIMTNVGIIVIEVKEYSGWIFGNGGQSQWTQVLAYGKQKYYFYNPIMQNIKHIAELQKHLSKFDTIPFYSMVVFYGDCVFKDINFVPEGTYVLKARRVLEVLGKIMRDNKPYIYENKNEVIRVLRDAVTNGGILENRIQHNRNIRDMLGKHRIFD